MDVQVCYENFRRSTSASKFGHQNRQPHSDVDGQVPPPTDLLDRLDADCPEMVVMEGNVVYPVPDHLTSVDFARFMVADQNFCNQEEPFYVVDLSRVLAQHQTWIQNLPRVQPFYAVKCNDHKVLLRMLASLGCNFDCASKGEIDTVLNIGVSPDRIIYANPCKTAGYIKHAASMDVRAMTFDNEHELYKIMKLHPDAELILRIAVSDPTAVCPLNLKFGCEPEQAAPALLKLAASIDANVIGISFHVGSGCRDSSAFGLGVAYARNLFDIGIKLGLNMNLLDVGGGFPGHKTELPFENIADTINRALDLHFPHDGVRIIAEPGRFYAAACFTLCCTIVAKNSVSADRISKREDDRDEAGFMYYINDGVYGSFNCLLYDHAVAVGAPLSAVDPRDVRRYPSAVWGPTCDSLDLVQPNVLLPEMAEGDWMVFENMGAYTCAAGSEFNGFPRPTFCYVVSQSDNAILNALFCEKSSMLDGGGTVVAQLPAQFAADAGLTGAAAVGGSRRSANHESDDDLASVGSSSFFSGSASSGFETDLDAAAAAPAAGGNGN